MRIILLTTLLFLTGCTILDNVAPQSRTTYELSSLMASRESSKQTNSRILVRLPIALTAIDSTRLVIRGADGRITWYSGAQWSDSVPRMVQARFVELFEDTGSFRSVLRPGDGISSSHHLLTDIRKFELGYDGIVRLELSMKLLSRKTGSIVASRIFNAEASAHRPVSSGISAFNNAFSIVASDVVLWVLSEV